MSFYKLQGRKYLPNIGKFFRKMGANVFRFMPGELKDLSKILLENVRKYVPKDTGTLSSSLVAEANINSIQIVALSSIQLSSQYMKEYAQFVEAGVFGKDVSRLVPTPEFGGPSVVRSPEDINYDLLNMLQATRLAHETLHGYAQFMRAGIYDTFPILLKYLSKLISDKVKREYRAIK